MEGGSNDSKESMASKKRSLVLSLPCSIDAPEACSSGLSPVCWFLSVLLPDPFLWSELPRRPEGLLARPDSAGSVTGGGVWLRPCSGGISMTTSSLVDRGGCEVLAEGIFVTACPRCGRNGGVLPPGLAGLLMCGVDGRHIIPPMQGCARLDCTAGVAAGRATHRSQYQGRCVACRCGPGVAAASTVRVMAVRTSQRAIKVLRRVVAFTATLHGIRHHRQ